MIALIIAGSIALYKAHGKPCACPSDTMRNGRPCGGQQRLEPPRWCKAAVLCRGHYRRNDLSLPRNQGDPARFGNGHKLKRPDTPPTCRLPCNSDPSSIPFADGGEQTSGLAQRRRPCITPLVGLARVPAVSEVPVALTRRSASLAAVNPTGRPSLDRRALAGLPRRFGSCPAARC